MLLAGAAAAAGAAMTAVAQRAWDYTKNYGANLPEIRSLMKQLGLTWSVIKKVSDLKPGDHISFPTYYASALYHHAIVTKVIDGKTVEIIKYTTTTPFAEIVLSPEDLSAHATGGYLYRADYKPQKGHEIFSEAEVVKRAREQVNKCGLGDKKYDILNNNSEHLTTWCKTGIAFSEQAGVKN